MLAQRLAPPDEPTYRSPWGFWSIGTIVLFVLVIIGNLFIDISRGSPRAFEVLVIVPTIIAPIVAWKWLTARSRHARTEEALPAWENAITKWQQLYYCHRCDGVFIPGREARLVPPGPMRDYFFDSD